MEARLTSNRSYVSLMISQFFSTLGSWVDLAAMLLLIGFTWRATPMAMGCVIMAFSGAMAIFGAAGGGIAAKLPPRATMTVAAIARAGLMLTFPLLTEVWQVCLVIVVKGFFIGLYPHAKEMQMKRNVSAQSFEKADFASNKIEEMCKFAGPLLSILLLVTIGQEYSFDLAAAAYFLSCVPLLFVAKGTDPAPAAVEEAPAEAAPGESGVTFVHRSPVLLFGMIAVAAAALFVTVADSQLAILFRGLPEGTVYIVLACMTASGFGTFLINWMFGKKTFQAPTLAVGLALLGIGFVIGGVGELYDSVASFVLFAIVFFFGGVCWQFMFVPFQNEILRRTPKSLLPAVFGYSGIVIVLCYSIGPVFGGAMVGWLGVTKTMLICGGVVAVIALAILLSKTAIERKDRQSSASA